MRNLLLIDGVLGVDGGRAHRFGPLTVGNQLVECQVVDQFAPAMAQHPGDRRGMGWPVTHL